ncbi:MAG: hypothetical protein WBD36_05375 [Bacteroidota bacterium]
MKTIIAAVIIVMASSETGYSQNVNWRSLREDQRNLVQLNFGYDFGVTSQISYNRFISTIKPAMLGLDISFPMGSNLLDDFKVKLGGQIEIAEIDGFSATIRISSIFRRYQTEMVSIASFGSDFAVLAGYDAPTWSVGGEFGFDKSITSHFKHSDIMRAEFPAIRDGWYVPTGGHYYYGIQGGKTIGESYDLSLRLGATRAQANDEDAMLPYYLQLGLGVRF